MNTSILKGKNTQKIIAVVLGAMVGFCLMSALIAAVNAHALEQQKPAINEGDTYKVGNKTLVNKCYHIDLLGGELCILS